jgi:hypothetical protein
MDQFLLAEYGLRVVKTTPRVSIASTSFLDRDPRSKCWLDIGLAAARAYGKTKDHPTLPLFIGRVIKKQCRSTGKGEDAMRLGIWLPFEISLPKTKLSDKALTKRLNTGPRVNNLSFLMFDGICAVRTVSTETIVVFNTGTILGHLCSAVETLCKSPADQLKGVRISSDPCMIADTGGVLDRGANSRMVWVSEHDLIEWVG